MYQLRSAGLQERGKSNHIPKGSVLTFSSEELGGRVGGKPSLTGRVDNPPGPSFPDSVYSLRFPPHSSHAQTSRKASQSKKKLFQLLEGKRQEFLCNDSLQNLLYLIDFD